MTDIVEHHESETNGENKESNGSLDDHKNNGSHEEIISEKDSKSISQDTGKDDNKDSKIEDTEKTKVVLRKDENEVVNVKTDSPKKSRDFYC